MKASFNKPSAMQVTPQLFKLTNKKPPMYHIEFAPKYRRKIAYGKKDIANIKYAM